MAFITASRHHLTQRLGIVSCVVALTMTSFYANATTSATPTCAGTKATSISTCQQLRVGGGAHCSSYWVSTGTTTGEQCGPGVAQYCVGAHNCTPPSS